MQPTIELVWFKRDLRIHDHRPLFEAAQRGAVLPLYIIEPSLIHAPDYDRRHYDFTRACLLELREALAQRGMPLVVRVGEALDVFATLQRDFAIAAIHAHEETGNAISFTRDNAVRRWTRQQGIELCETPNNGVIRPLGDRDQRVRLWNRLVAEQALLPAPEAVRPVEIDPGAIPAWDELGIRDEGIVMLQAAGESEAHRLLRSFLYERGSRYHQEMSSPVTAGASGSRISPHLAYGTLSLRQVFRALEQRRAEISQMSQQDYQQLDGSWKSALRAFESRLHWHDHFIQKLEDEPRIEYESFVPAYDTLRDDPAHDGEAADRFAAYAQGRTGYPMVDACMRSLRATGWINFRMRAMLVSFASYDLWLKWPATAQLLARLFTDYEPGIHYSQVQMQSGTTGINTLRVYNPTKQGQDHDPDGIFIRQWVPELRDMPPEYLHEPHKLPPMFQHEAGCIIGEDYPAPIVEHKSAVKEARSRIWDLRKQPQVKAVAAQVAQRHGSRKRR